MLQLYFRWRYRRSQRAAAFKLPERDHSRGSTRQHFGSYLAQQTVRGNVTSPIDQSKNRRRWLRRLAIIAAVLLVAWIIYESLHAIQAWIE